MDAGGVAHIAQGVDRAAARDVNAVDGHQVAVRATDLDGRAGIAVEHAAARDRALDDQAVSVRARAVGIEVHVPAAGADRDCGGRAVNGHRTGGLGGVDDAVAIQVARDVGLQGSHRRCADEDAAVHVRADLQGGARDQHILGKELGVDRRVGAAAGEAVARRGDGPIDAEGAADVALEAGAYRVLTGRADRAGDQGLARQSAGHRQGRRIIAGHRDRARLNQVALHRRVEGHAEGIVALHGDLGAGSVSDGSDKSPWPHQVHAVAVRALGKGAVQHAVAVGVGAGVGLVVGDRAIVGQQAGVAAVQQDRGGIVLARDGDGAVVGDVVARIHRHRDGTGHAHRGAGADDHVVGLAVVGRRRFHRCAGRVHGGVRPGGRCKQQQGRAGSRREQQHTHAGAPPTPIDKRLSTNCPLLQQGEVQA